MYVHVGDDVMIRVTEIIAILDKNTVKQSDMMQALLEEKKDIVINVANGSFKSLVITASYMYLSPIALATLKKHAYEWTYEENSLSINGEEIDRKCR